MLIDMMLRRFRPVFAMDDGAGTGGAVQDAADTVEAIVGADTGADAGDEGDDIEIDLGDGEGEADTTEFDDFDFDGVKLKVPKGKQKDIEDALLRQSDYTKKTQAAADREKAAEAREKAMQIRTQHDEHISEGRVHLKMMDGDLNKEYTFFQSPEYRKLQEDDPLGAQARFNRFQMNRDARAQLAGALGVLENERNSKIAEADKAAQAEASKRKEQLPREIAKLVPGWNADMAGKVKAYAVAAGYAPEAIDNTTDPLHFKTLHEAMIGRMYLDAKSRKGQGAVTPKTAQPTKTIGQRGGSIASGPSDKMSTDDWMEAERKRVTSQAAKRKAAR